MHGTRAALRDAFDGVSVVASLAGPFLEVGLVPVRALSPWARTTSTRAGSRSGLPCSTRSSGRRRPCCPRSAFDYVPGDLAARLAAEQVEGLLDEIVVAYSVKGVGTSRGRAARSGT